MKFSELKVDDKFILNGVSYKKVTAVKISCCKSINAINLSNNQKVMIKPTDEVEVVTE